MYIKRNEAIKTTEILIRKQRDENRFDSVYEALGYLKGLLRTMDAADVAPVVHGRWVKDGDWLICLNCESEINVKNSLGVENRKNYCPNCGAKMDGGTNG